MLKYSQTDINTSCTQCVKWLVRCDRVKWHSSVSKKTTKQYYLTLSTHNHKKTEWDLAGLTHKLLIKRQSNNCLNVWIHNGNGFENRRQLAQDYHVLYPQAATTDTTCVNMTWLSLRYYAPPLIGGGINRCFCPMSICLSDVCLSRTSGVSREQRPRKTKILAQR